MHSIRLTMVLHTSTLRITRYAMYLANTCQLTWHALCSKYFPLSLVSKLTIDSGKESPGGNKLMTNCQTLQNHLHSATTSHTFTWKVAILALVDCWFSCAEIATLLGPWAKTAADQWKQKHNCYHILYMTNMESRPWSGSKTATTAVHFIFAVSLIPNLPLVTLNQWLNNQDG